MVAFLPNAWRGAKKIRKDALSDLKAAKKLGDELTDAVLPAVEKVIVAPGEIIAKGTKKLFKEVIPTNEQAEADKQLADAAAHLTQESA